MEKNERIGIALICRDSQLVFYYSDKNGGLGRATQDLAVSIGMSILEQKMDSVASVVLLSVPDRIKGSDEQIAEKLTSQMDKERKEMLSEYNNGNMPLFESEIRSSHVKSFHVKDKTDMADGFAQAMSSVARCMTAIPSNTNKSDLDLLSKKLESGEFSPEDFGCPDPDKRN
jgi:hypothetical protein